MTASESLPGRDCPLCPRLVAYRHQARADHPDWHNAPVDSFGPTDTPLLIVGLAPGMRGANCTGRPFTGDFAGDLLYATLQTFGFAHGDYGGQADDGLKLIGCRITNAVRCVPPENKPVAAEVNACRKFLIGEIESLGSPSCELSWRWAPSPTTPCCEPWATSKAPPNSPTAPSTNCPAA